MNHPDFDPDYVFAHHDATPELVAQHEKVHAGAKRFAEIILANAPQSSDRNAALRLLRESAMMANAAIALRGRLK
jgi:hypothetical protein